MGIRKLSSLINSEYFKVNTTESQTSADAFVAVLSRYISYFVKSPRASLRAAVASLLWRLEDQGRNEPWVAELLNTLKCDNRARVRFEADGGWQDARKRVVTRESY